MERVVISTEVNAMRLDLIEFLVDSFNEYLDTDKDTYQFNIGSDITLRYETIQDTAGQTCIYYQINIQGNGINANLDFDYQDIEEVIDNIINVLTE